MHRFIMRPLLMSLAAFFTAAPVPLPIALAAESVPLEIRSVEIGYGGVYVSGYMTPLWLTLRSTTDESGVIEVLAPDGDGVPVAFAAYADKDAPVTTLRAGKDTTVWSYVKIGPEKSPLTVRLRDPQSNRILWKERLSTSDPSVPSSTEVIVSLGSSPALVEAAKLLPRASNRLVVATTISDPAFVPDAWQGWEGVRTVVVSIGREAISERLAPSQWIALREWVEYGGGRLVVCLGEGSKERLPPGHPLAELLPARLVDVVPLRDLQRLNELTGHPFASATDAARPPLAQLADARGRIELTVTGQREELPLLVRASHGFGEVALLALDPDAAALASWPGRGRLLLPALFEEDRNAAAAKGPRRALRLGYDDLAGQLRTALDSFPQVRVVNVTTVAMLTLAYLALVGPLEFFVLRRLRLPSTMTWICFPLIAAGFCAVGWYAAQAAHGAKPLTRQCEVIDIDVQSKLVRGTVWLHVYTPATATYEVSLAVEGTPIGLAGRPQGWLSWQGLPGNGLGGLSANQLATPAIRPYQHGPANDGLSLSEVPIQIAASKSLSARWWGETSLEPPLPLSVNQFNLLDGEVVNPLPATLHDCLLVYDERMYRLRTLSPGQRFRVADFDPLNLEARLQQRTVANARDVISPWDPQSADVPRIVQMMMFHDAARGSAYTNLANRYQGYLDLTSRIRNDRAVLVGRLDEPVTRVNLGDSAADVPLDAASWTWVRIVLPLQPTPTQQP